MKTRSPDEFLQTIHTLAVKIGRRVRLMEVCGTHTTAIARAGLRSTLPESIELVSGPGCPVCVTAQREIERMLLLARRSNVIICTFGDMIRVPGVDSSLEQERSRGADIRVVYSPDDAMHIAEEKTEKEIVFLAVGFETTAPGIAATVLEAVEKKIKNFSLFVSHKLITPAMEAVLHGGASIDGFITPGHVSVVLGSNEFTPLAEKFTIPCVATGFEPSDVLEGIAMLLEAIAEKRCGSFIQYVRAVKPDGNPRAREILFRVYEITDAEWRGLGIIPQSGLRLKKEFSSLDAIERFSLPQIPPVELSDCLCGDVLKGNIHPNECPLFGQACTPRTPVGPCMVSSEGACAARYKYGG
ncbi:MAG: hydrogenase formation protein HypD [Candidatus Omnitrophota bacterium]|jgi:hydrogenase expression/formation protein HypD|nr:MAG: hydrogenase formation protein HypD [Candidatus Omnitrophota bacterium]